MASAFVPLESAHVCMYVRALFVETAHGVHLQSTKGAEHGQTSSENSLHRESVPHHGHPMGKCILSNGGTTSTDYQSTLVGSGTMFRKNEKLLIWCIYKPIQ